MRATESISHATAYREQHDNVQKRRILWGRNVFLYGNIFSINRMAWLCLLYLYICHDASNWTEFIVNSIFSCILCASRVCMCTLFSLSPSHQRFSNRKIRCKLIIKAFVVRSSYEMAFQFMVLNKTERCFTSERALTAVWMASYTFGLYVWFAKFFGNIIKNPRWSMRDFRCVCSLLVADFRVSNEKSCVIFQGERERDRKNPERLVCCRCFGAHLLAEISLIKPDVVIWVAHNVWALK